MLEQLFPLGVNHYVYGGLLVGIGIVIPYFTSGLIVGVSTVFTSTWSYFSRGSFFQSSVFIETRHWRLALALGLVTGGVLYTYLTQDTVTITTIEIWRLFWGGVIIGVGTRMSGGCASGHGICGNASLQLPSLLATITFLLVAIITAHLISIILHV